MAAKLAQRTKTKALPKVVVKAMVLPKEDIKVKAKPLPVKLRGSLQYSLDFRAPVATKLPKPVRPIIVPKAVAEAAMSPKVKVLAKAEVEAYRASQFRRFAHHV